MRVEARVHPEGLARWAHPTPTLEAAMTADARTVEVFRQRLWQLVADRFEGKYSWLARRAGIPVSSLQHILHQAKRIPGGAQLLQLAAALEVSVDYLLGRE